MPKTRINCPNCRQPVVAEIEQLFDVGADPQAKQRLLSGGANVIQCQSCGYVGNIATPMVYHDPEKELLLTFAPPELGIKLEEQERILGPLIKKAVDALPKEKRKAYLFRPQNVLTMQGLVERVLEADGITKEMIQAQQKKLALIQRLAGVTADDVLAEIIKQEDKNIDAEFFALLNRLLEASIMGGDQQSAQVLSALQKKLIPITTYGKRVQERNQEIQAAAKSLQDLGDEMSQEKLLDLVIQAENEVRVQALASFARPVMDYTFFQLLTERIERANGEQKKKLSALRERLLVVTREIDLQMEARMAQTRQLLEAILREPNIEEAMQQAMPAVDDLFIQALQAELEAARKAADLGKISKLQKINQILEEASAPPPEMELIQELLEAEDEAELKSRLEVHRQEITPQFVEMLMALMSQPQAAQNPEVNERLQMLYRLVVRISMQNSMKQ